MSLELPNGGLLKRRQRGWTAMCPRVVKCRRIR